MAHYQCDCGAEDCKYCHPENCQEWRSEDGYNADDERKIDSLVFENYRERME